MSYATRGSGPASQLNELQDSGQYFGDKERQRVRAQALKGRGKGKVTDPARTRAPDFRTKPQANDILKQLMAEPGGIKQMSDAAQYGKLVEMRQKQAMLDRSDGALREFQRLTQSMSAANRERVRRGEPAPEVSPQVQQAVANAMARQRRELEEAGVSLQGRPAQRDRTQRPTAVGGTGNVDARPVIGEVMGGGDGGFGRAFGIGRAVGRAGR